MPYDVVMATRNRPSALTMSLPLIRAQTVPPNKLILVDASDDPAPTRAAVEAALSGSGITVDVLGCEAPSSARQRNFGLDRVTAPIVMMPDDDSLWFPDTAEQTLRIYALDTAGVVAGVTGAPTNLSPLESGAETYRKDRQRLWKTALQPWRNRIEGQLFEPPFARFARDGWRGKAVPGWVDGRQSALVEHIAGFRMSFRSEAIKAARFDELLGYRTGYAQFEDTEVSLRLQKGGGLLVSAEAARVFHHVFPSKRTGGFDYGFGQITNYIYVCRKLMPERSAAWRGLERYLFYKLQLYRLRRDNYSRSVFDGARAAWANRRRLMTTPVEELEETFKMLCNSVRP